MIGDPEKLITLSEAAKLAPGRPHATALWRWCRQGITTRSGDRVYLESARFGRRVFTSAEALARFGERLAEADRQHFASARRPRRTKHTNKGRQRAIAYAEATLEGAGIKETPK